MTAAVECTTRKMAINPPTCRCDECAQKRYRARKKARLGIPNGAPAVEAVLPVLDMMIAQRYDTVAASSATGVPQDTIGQWMNSRRRGQALKIWPAGRIALANHQPPTAGTMSALVPKRKLRALAAIGHSIPALLAEVLPDIPFHTGKTMLGEVRSGLRKTMPVTCVIAVDTYYARWHMHPVAGTRSSRCTRAVARRNKWAAPLAWDDIDDPDPLVYPVGWTFRSVGRPKGQVDPQVVERAIAGDNLTPLTIAEKRIIVPRMVAEGYHARDITRMTGITKPERYLEATA